MILNAKKDISHHFQLGPVAFEPSSDRVIRRLLVIVLYCQILMSANTHIHALQKLQHVCSAFCTMIKHQFQSIKTGCSKS